MGWVGRRAVLGAVHENVVVSQYNLPAPFDPNAHPTHFLPLLSSGPLLFCGVGFFFVPAMSLKKLAKVDSIKKVLKRDKDEASTAPEPSDLHGTIAEDSNNISKMTSVLTTAKVDWSMHDDEVAGAHPHIELGSVQEAELAAELKKRVPPEAVRENEELVDFMVLACLRFRRYDMATAEERVLNYLRWRRDTFGDLAPHTLNTDPRLRERVQQQFLGVLPQRVTSGEAVLLVQLRFLEPHKYTPLESLKAWHWWVMQTLRQVPFLFGLRGNPHSPTLRLGSPFHRAILRSI